MTTPATLLTMNLLLFSKIQVSSMTRFPLTFLYLYRCFSRQDGEHLGHLDFCGIMQQAHRHTVQYSLLSYEKEGEK